MDTPECYAADYLREHIEKDDLPLEIKEGDVYFVTTRVSLSVLLDSWKVGHSIGALTSEMYTELNYYHVVKVIDSYARNRHKYERYLGAKDQYERSIKDIVVDEEAQQNLQKRVDNNDI